MALDTLRPFGFNPLLRGSALTGSPPALERLFIASTHISGQSIVAGQSNSGHGDPCAPQRATI
jgi:hypothetical protein